MISAVPAAFGFDTARSMLYTLKDRFPFARFGVIGRSWAGRAIFSLSIGEGAESVLFTGGFSGQENRSSLCLYRFFERLCLSLESDGKLCAVKIKPSLENRKIVLVPNVNPDGTEIARLGSHGAGCYAGLAERAANGDFIHWHANARGVDIRHNFGADWEAFHKAQTEAGILKPAPQGYGGPSPESEPEARSLTRLCTVLPFRHAFILGQGEPKILWKHGENRDSESAMMARVLSSVSGIPQETEPSAPEGDFAGWFAKKKQRPAIKVQIGEENALGDFEATYQRLEELLLLGSIM